MSSYRPPASTAMFIPFFYSFMSMQLSIQFKASCFRPAYEPLKRHLPKLRALFYAAIKSSRDSQKKPNNPHGNRDFQAAVRDCLL